MHDDEWASRAAPAPNRLPKVLGSVQTMARRKHPWPQASDGETLATLATTR